MKDLTTSCTIDQTINALLGWITKTEERIERGDPPDSTQTISDREAISIIEKEITRLNKIADLTVINRLVSRKIEGGRNAHDRR